VVSVARAVIVLLSVVSVVQMKVVKIHLCHSALPAGKSKANLNY